MSNPLSYACQDLLEKQNYVNLVEVTYLYDLAYPTSLDTGTARLEVESNLLKQIAAVYGLGSGSACTEPPLEGLWVLKASSVPQNGTDVFGTRVLCVLLKVFSTNEFTNDEPSSQENA